MTSLQQLSCISLVQCASDEEGDVVDHVGVSEVVHELGKAAGRIGLDISELGDELIERLVGERGGGGVGGEGRKEVTVGRAELEFDVYMASVSEALGGSLGE